MITPVQRNEPKRLPWAWCAFRTWRTRLTCSSRAAGRGPRARSRCSRWTVSESCRWTAAACWPSPRPSTSRTLKQTQSGQVNIRLVQVERDREMFYLMTHSTHFIYGYMASDIWVRTILIVRKETRCRHIGYYYRLTARVLLYAPSHRQDNTYHSLCYTSRGALAGTKY